MAVNLLGSSDARIDYGDLAAFDGHSAFSVAITVRLSAAPASGQRMFQQWGNTPGERSWILNADSTDELGFCIVNGASGGFYGKITTDVNLTNGTLYRIVCKVNSAANAGAIWVNGVSRTVTPYVASDSTQTGTSTTPVEIGRGIDELVDGLDADYSEVAAWSTYVPDWFCEAYGKGYSPDFYLPSRIFYAPLFNTSHLLDRQGGVAGTNSSGTDAAHPSMLYPIRVAQ